MAGIIETIANVSNPVAQGLGVLEGGIQLFSNIGKEKRAREELAKIQQPFYAIQDEYLQNRNIAGGLAQGGLPQEELDYITGETQRGLGAGISGTLQSGGNPNNIAKMFDVYSKAIDRTGAESASQHLKNIQFYMDANKDYAGQKIQQWAINKYEPYKRKYNELNRQRGAAEANAYGGANTLIGSLSGLGTGLSNNYLLDNLFAENQDDTTPRRITNSGIDNLPTSSSKPLY